MKNSKSSSSEHEKSFNGRSEETIIQADYINEAFEDVNLPKENCCSPNEDNVEKYSTSGTKGSRWSVGNLINLSYLKCCCHCSRNRQIHSKDYCQSQNISLNHNFVQNSVIEENQKSTYKQQIKCDKIKQIVTCNSVRHVQQLYSWDCGISCVLMILPDKHYNYFAKNISKVSAEEGYQKRFKVPFHYFTITLGVDPGLAEEKFYSRVLSKDQLRVQDRFQDAAANGISVEKKSVSLGTLVDHLSKQLPIIILVNANVLLCRTCVAEESSCLPKNRTSSYAGHFILLVGYNLGEELFFYFDPAINSHTCSSSFKNIDEARFSYGTDQDIIFIDHCSS